MTLIHESYIMIKTLCITLPFFWSSWIKTSSFGDKTQVLQSDGPWFQSQLSFYKLCDLEQIDSHSKINFPVCKIHNPIKAETHQ